MSYLQSIISSEEQRKLLITSLHDALNGDTQMQGTVLCFVGDAGSGKSTLLDVIRSVFNKKQKVTQGVYSELPLMRADLYLTDEDLSPLQIKDVTDRGGLWLMTAYKVPEGESWSDQGMKRRVSFIQLDIHTLKGDERKTFDKEGACRSLEQDLCSIQASPSSCDENA